MRSLRSVYDYSMFSAFVKHYFLDLQNIFQHFYGDMAAEVSGHYVNFI